MDPLYSEVRPLLDGYVDALKHDHGNQYIKENIRSGVLNVSRSIIQILFLGFAKVKSEKVLSSFAPASSIAIHHGSMMCCQDPRFGNW